MEFWTGGLGGTEYPTSAMTSDTEPSPLVASASGDVSGSEAWHGFEGLAQIAKYWQYQSVTFPIFLKIDLGSGNGIAPTYCRMNAPETPDRSPKDFTIEGSNNDSDWTVLGTYTGVTGWTAYSEKNFAINGNHFTDSGLAANDLGHIRTEILNGFVAEITQSPEPR